MSSQWIQDHNFSSSDRADLCLFGWAPERCDLQLESKPEEDQRSLCTLVWHCGEPESSPVRDAGGRSAWVTLHSQALCSFNGRTGGIVLSGFPLCGVFCFVLCFGAECVEVKLNTWSAFTIQSPHIHSMRTSFSFFLVFLWGIWDLSSPTRDGTNALCNGSVEFERLGHQESPDHPFFAGGIIRERVCSSPETHVFCN